MALHELPEKERLPRFADAFWDDGDQGIKRITDKLNASRQTCQEILNLYEHRAKIEDDYGERLLQLSQMLIGETEEGTLAESISHVPSAIETTARAHADLAEQLRLHLHTPLSGFIKEQAIRREQQHKKIEASWRNRATHYTNAARARDFYMGGCSKLKSMERYLNERSTEMEPDEIQQVREEIEDERKIVKEADSKFKKATEELSKVNQQWISEWREACDVYQEMEETRISFTRSSLWAFANMMSSVYIVDDQCCERIRTALESTNVQKDIQTIIDGYGTGKKVTETIQYENLLNPTPITVSDAEQESATEPSLNTENSSPVFPPSTPLENGVEKSIEHPVQPNEKIELPDHHEPSISLEKPADSVSTQSSISSLPALTPKASLPEVVAERQPRKPSPDISTEQDEKTFVGTMSPRSPVFTPLPTNLINGNEFIERTRYDDERNEKSFKRDTMDSVMKEVDTVFDSVGKGLDGLGASVASLQFKGVQPETTRASEFSSTRIPDPASPSDAPEKRRFIPMTLFGQQQRSISSPFPISDQRDQLKHEPIANGSPVTNEAVWRPADEKWLVSTTQTPEDQAVQNLEPHAFEPQDAGASDEEVRPAPPPQRQSVFKSMRAQLRPTIRKRKDSGKSSKSREGITVDPMPNEGIRPPPWHEHKRDYLNSDPTSRRKNSVSGPRPPPPINTNLAPPVSDQMHDDESMDPPRSASPEPTPKTALGVGFMKHVFTNKSSHNIGSANKSTHNLGSANKSSNNVSVQPKPSTSTPTKDSSRFSIAFFGKKRKDDNIPPNPFLSTDELPAKESAKEHQSEIARNFVSEQSTILFYTVALWDYQAKIPSELSFSCGDHFAILYQHSDGWWEAESLDPIRSKRGLIPGNYMRRV